VYGERSVARFQDGDGGLDGGGCEREHSAYR
jgi:hypothetical protein